MTSRKRVNFEFAQQYLEFLVDEVEKGEVFEIEFNDKRFLLLPYENYKKETDQLKELTEEIKNQDPT